MNLTLTEDQELIRSTARELLQSRREEVRAAAGDPLGYPAALWAELIELGWAGLPLPEACGGVGAGFLELCLLIEELGYAGVPSPLLPTVACCALPIARFGTEEQRARWLPAVARGRVLSPVARAWDRARAEVIASAGRDGGYVLDGTALFVPYAHAAEDLLVATADGTTLLVEATAPGLSREPLDAIGTDRPHRVVFEAVAVPADRVVPGGRAVAEAIDAYGAAATCAAMVGAAQRVLDMTVEYAKSRTQFGRPIGAFQAVQHHCADMAIDVLGSRFIAYEAIWSLSAGLAATTEVPVAKAWVSEAARRVCDRGHQVHGAIGFTAEHDLHLLTRDIMAAALSFGDADHHWERIAHRLDLPACEQHGTAGHPR